MGWCGVPRALGLATFGVMLAQASGADAQCARPTDPPPGYAGRSYGPDTARSFDSERIRVWYTMSGLHAVRPASTRTDGTPDDVVEVSQIAEAALSRFAASGYRAPISDGEISCGSNGGDGRLDIYLVDFAAADGSTVTERCTTPPGARALQCAGFVLVEARMDLKYPTSTEGFRTVVPHEVFHAVQNAYDAELDRSFAEGSAQLATKRLYPELRDLERFLPAFLTDTSRALDTPGGGVTSGFLYGSALWPLFLEERHGDSVVRGVLEEASSTGASVLDATAEVLAARGSTLGATFLHFATWNVATGRRAGDGGYPDARTYPEAKLEPWPTGATAPLSGLAARYFRVATDVRASLYIDADPARVGATFVPMEAGVARLSRASPLPANVEGEGVVVVAGLTPSKSDAPFVLGLGAPLPEPPPPLPAATSAGSGQPRETSNGAEAPGGCSIPQLPAGNAPIARLTPLALLAAVARKKKHSP